MRFDPIPLERRPLWQLLNIVAEQFNCGWKRKGSFILFLHDQWPGEEEKEIPERVLEQWRHDGKPARVTSREYLDALGRLSLAQLAAMPMQFPGTETDAPFIWERLLSSLTSKQKERLLSGERLGFADLLRRQQQLATLLFPRALTALPAAVRTLTVAVEEADGTLKGSLRIGQVVRPYTVPLPMKEPALPAAMVRLAPAR